VQAVITVEENMLQGGFGSAVLEALQIHNIAARVVRLGIPDKFVEQGTQEMLRATYGIDADGIYAAVKKILLEEQAGLAQHKKTAAG